MKYSLCTISFRHQLISFGDLLRFAEEHGFDGIELWGAHAENLYTSEPGRTLEDLQQMRDRGLEISMISDYLDVSASADFAKTIEQCGRLLELAGWFGAKRIRTFAGREPSCLVSASEREAMTKRLHILADLCLQRGVVLLLETHPNTLTDNLDSTLAVLQSASHEALRINLDFLHLWEAGDDVLESFERLKPWVEHYHLKNISTRGQLHVFEPHNVYSASGSRVGMTPLADGALDYRPILSRIQDTALFGSIEWFGANPAGMLSHEIRWLHAQRDRAQALLAAPQAAAAASASE